jgi:hypothetical protein
MTASPTREHPPCVHRRFRMKRLVRYLAWLLLAATPLAVVAGRLAWAQRPAARQPAAVPKQQPAAQQPFEDDDPDEDADARLQRPLEQQRAMLQAALQARQASYRQYFDRLVFGSNAPADEAALRAQYEAGFAKEIDRLERICGLDASQTRKLHAAGRGDIKRFFDHVTEARSRVLSIQNAAMLLNEARKESQPLSHERVALASGGSPILTKAIQHTITEEQNDRLKKDDDDRRAFRHRAAVRWTVVMLARSLGLSDDQRRRLETVLLAETRPPRRFETFDYPIVMNQASHVAEAKIRPIFDELQWRIIKQEFAVARGQERWLRAGGLLPLEMVGD